MANLAPKMMETITVVQNCCKGHSNKYRKRQFGVLPPRNPLTDLHEIWYGFEFEFDDDVLDRRYL